LADHRKKTDTTELWFAKRIIDEIEMISIDEDLPAVIQQMKSTAIEQLHSGDVKSVLEQIELNHKEFFQPGINFQVDGSALNNLKKTDISDKPAGELAAFLRVSPESISASIRSDYHRKGVLISDLLSLSKEDSSMIPDLEKNGHLLRNSGTSPLLHAITSNAMVIVIPDHVEINEMMRVEIITESTENIVPFHLITKIGRNAKANILICIKSTKKQTSSSISVLQNDFSLAENAELNVFRHQTAGKDSLILVDDHIKQDRNSKVGFLNVDEGAKGLSSKISVFLDGEGAESTVTGIYRPEKNSRFFYDTEQIHTASNTKSDLLYKGVIGENAYTSWKGNIVIEENTRATNGYQANNNLVIHESAKIESVPGLEIKTDDVKCSHGVTIGNIDKNHMFYLQSRGINKDAAEKLIIHGFLRSALNRTSTDVFSDQESTLFDF